MSNYFFSFEFLYLLQFWVIFSRHNLVLNAHPLHLQKVFFHSCWESLFFIFFVLVSSMFLRSSISVNTFPLPWGTSHRDKSKYCGNIICMESIIWFRTYHKMFTTKPSIAKLFLKFESILSIPCSNPLFTSFCSLLIFHGTKPVKLDILITFLSHICALYCATTVWHLYNNC